jgi:predicted DNA binding CopG/RHH family protein
MYTSTKDLHEAEIKVRLTEDDAELVKLLARRLGIPPAVYLRSIVKQALSSGCASNANNNAAVAR